MKFNDYYCTVDEVKLTEAEWNEVHAHEVKNEMFDEYGYWHCNSYVSYSASFDRCMAYQIKYRESLRNWYRRMIKEAYTPDFVHEWSDFSDSFKSVYGYRPKFIETVLNHKGVSIETYRSDLDKSVEEWMNNIKKEAI